MNIEQTANVTTGSNYAKDWSDALPIRPEFDSGPFFHKPELRVARNVLTKTHCSGYCDDCPPLAYVSTDADFEQGCLRVELPNRGGDVHYDSSIPVKIVHLFRSPFDNIVARMHLAVKKREKMGWSADQLATFENTKEGLEAWCEYLDQKYAEEESTFFPESVTRYFQELPCHSDWYRYVMWHNHAFNLTKKLNIPIHYVYYEDYTHRYDETLEALLDFLEVSSRQPPIDFYVGKSYESFYDVSHAQKATAMARALGSSETWSHLQHYFEPFM